VQVTEQVLKDIHGVDIAIECAYGRLEKKGVTVPALGKLSALRITESGAFNVRQKPPDDP
jgi:hypothetical protein